jgi:hypothetical protein
MSSEGELDGFLQEADQTLTPGYLKRLSKAGNDYAAALTHDPTTKKGKKAFAKAVEA